MSENKQINKNKLSPMMQQYFKIKEQYPDMLLFFRLGDFYELFFDDAQIGSDVLGLTLTSKDCGAKERAPMCGVPYHSAETYIARLIENGYKVAICEQLENPAEAKGIVKRDVTRIMTSGTLIDDEMLDDAQNNYLCSICKKGEEAGICFADSSTAQFHITFVNGKNIEDEIINQLASYQPKEVIANAETLELDEVKEFVKSRLKTEIQLLGDEKYDFDAATAVIFETLKSEEVGQLNLGQSRAAVSALGAVIDYLLLCQKSADIENGASVEFFEKSKYMQLDMNARRSLELTSSMMTSDKSHSLLSVIDKTKTSPGKRLMKSWLERPLMSIEEIEKRQQAVGELVKSPGRRDKIRQTLTGSNDMERLVTRVAYGSANARELKALQKTVERLPKIKEQLKDSRAEMLLRIYDEIDTLPDVAELIDKAISDSPPVLIREGGLIKPGYSKELDEILYIKDDAAGAISAMEYDEKEKTGIPKLKIGYNRIFGYYIEITNSYKNLVPESYTRKQTLANCERYITPELKELEVKILSASERDFALQYKLFCEVRDRVAEQAERLRRTARAYAELDAVAALAETAVQNNYTCPHINSEGIVDIKEGRHPVVEELLSGEPFVPNDARLDKENYRCAIITGPNMAGKSTYMRQIALIVLLAQIGSFVPAKKADIGVVDAIYTRVGAADDLSTGQSTFMVEMNEVSSILKSATADSLIILDEIGRGTSTYDGMSIARAVLEYACRKSTLGAKTLFATHYHELTVMEGELDGVHNYSVAVKKRGDDITFLRRIVEGGADESFGIEVAKLAGVPDGVVERAKVILGELEEGSDAELRLEAREYSAAPLPDEEEAAQKRKKDEILNTLGRVDVETLTPIEAMTALYELKKKLQEIL